MNPRYSVLVAEDNAAMARVIQFNFQRKGFDATIVANGSDAWSRVQRSTFDAVVTDQQMPGMTGVDFCRKLRDLPDYADTPIFLVTAKKLELDLSQLADELHIAATFAKPFSPTQLVDCVAEALNRCKEEPAGA